MSQLIRFSFALTPRLQSFIDLRDGLQCLNQARQHQDTYGWLLAANDVRASLLGSTGRKAAIPELMALMKAMRLHLHSLAEAHTDFYDDIMHACTTIEEHETTIHQCIPATLDFLNSDGLLIAWNNALQKNDALAYKLNFPQTLPTLWNALRIQDLLDKHLEELCAITTHIDAMLNDFVPWLSRTADEGHDQITSSTGNKNGLLIIGLDSTWVERGIVPDFSGNRLAIRLRFLAWNPGSEQTSCSESIPYKMMMVPIT